MDPHEGSTLADQFVADVRLAAPPLDRLILVDHAGALFEQRGGNEKPLTLTDVSVVLAAVAVLRLDACLRLFGQDTGGLQRVHGVGHALRMG